MSLGTILSIGGVRDAVKGAEAKMVSPTVGSVYCSQNAATDIDSRDDIGVPYFGSVNGEYQERKKIKEVCGGWPEISPICH